MLPSRTATDLVAWSGFWHLPPPSQAFSLGQCSPQAFQTNYSSSQHILQPVSIFLVIKEPETVVLLQGDCFAERDLWQFVIHARSHCWNSSLFPPAVCCKTFLCIRFTCFYIYERETDLLLSVSPAPSLPIMKSANVYLQFSGSFQLILLSSVSTCLLHSVRFSTPFQAEASSANLHLLLN